MTHRTYTLLKLIAAMLLLAMVHGCSSSGDDPQRDVADDSGAQAQQDAPDASSMAGQSGQLVEAIPLDLLDSIPAASSVTRITYRMNAVDGGLTDAVALMFVPGSEAPAGGYPLIVWAHGTTGISDACAPSNNFDSLGNPTVINRLLERGYAVVAPDYEGLGTPGVHPYLVRSSHANSLLDVLPAVHQMQTVALDSSWALVGHSQGGHAVLSAARAPQLSEFPLVAVAALAPGLDVRLQSEALFEAAQQLELSGDLNGAADRIFFLNLYGAYLAQAFALEVDGFVPQSIFGQTVAPLIDRALDESTCGDYANQIIDALRQHILSGNLVTDFEGLRRDWPSNPTLMPLLEREDFFDEPQSMPLLLVQGDIDDQVSVSVADSFVEQQRSVGTPLDYMRISGAGHGDVIRSEFARTLDFLGVHLPASEPPGS